jgi:hypothetical protein
VLLLLVMALLAMFALLIVAFIAVAMHDRRSAEIIARIDRVLDPPERLLNQAFGVVARGSASPASRLTACSLLEEMYGNDTVSGTIGNVTPVCDGQLLEFSLPGGNVRDVARRIGCVLTMTSGAAAGQSTRICGINPTNGNPQMMAFPGSPRLAPADSYIINGVPFSGMGFGYSPSAGRTGPALTVKRPVTVDGQSVDCELALLPGAPENADPAGGANSDYTAADYQHMLLAYQVPVQRNGATSVATPLPSLHRPELIRYWANRLSITDWARAPELLRMIMLRPNAIDHPNFPRIDPVGGPWDVDNDGDGVPDSVWVDLGLQVRWTADGRAYKPMFAILCLDMDGRLNVNAHGMCKQAEPGSRDSADFPMPGWLLADGTTNVASLPRGQGYGPAEINLMPLFSTAGATMQYSLYQSLLTGNAAMELLGRYGESAFASAGTNVPLLGSPPAIRPLVANRWFDYSGDYWNDRANPNCGFDAYGSPPDPQGYGAVALDPAGRPLYLSMGGSIANTPYSVDLSNGARQSAERHNNSYTAGEPVYSPFGPAEMERILRPYDRDAATLPARLATLTAMRPGDPGTSVLLAKRYAATTESWNVPCPSIALPPALRVAMQSNQNGGVGDRPRHVVDLLVARLIREGVPQDQWNARIRDLLPPEMLAGLKMNLNRPLGAVGKVPLAFRNTPTGETISQFKNPTQRIDVPLNYYPQGSPHGTEADAIAARQLYAKHLYILMMLLADGNSLSRQLGGGPEDVARYLAQWAINVVSFRDHHAAMIPFPFDPSPWGNGWRPENVSQPEHTVWGCKRPELLITETLAFHDRRTEDLESPGGTTTDAEKPDPDCDQRYRPEGSLFIELYNPWSPAEPSSDLHVSVGSGRWGVQLDKATANGSPIWRLAIVDGSQSGLDPDDPVFANQPLIERSVYFTNPPPSPVLGDHAIFYTTVSPAPILSGRYAVIGSGDGGGRTIIGQRPDGITGLYRQIVLTPSPNPDRSNQVQVLNNGIKDGATNDLPTGTICPPVAVLINQPQRLSVTEPIGGYPETKGASRFDPLTRSYVPPLDHPLDTDLRLQRTATSVGYKIVYLQRLANPLQDYDPLANPYRTVDRMPVDMTAFNGITSDHDPQDIGGTVAFRCRERGRNNESPQSNNLWKQEPLIVPIQQDAKEAGGYQDFIPYRLGHTLGYLNSAFGTPYPVAGPYLGDPSGGPFPWLNWSDRPFVSPQELLLVPAVRSFQLLDIYDLPSTNADPYGADAAPYPHLLNFFAQPEATVQSPQFQRLLEYVEVPSPFSGTETQTNPDPNANDRGDHLFHTPFNRISKYREPGRVNLNTIASPEVLQGLMNYMPGMADSSSIDTFWSKFVQSRQGGAGGGPNDASLPDPAFPTRFARPFRSFGGATLVPLANLIPPAADPLQPTREIEATLMRSDPSDPTRPLFNVDSTAPATNSLRNPYFKFQALQRIGNLVTTRSNVYAVWITVGYFEAVPVTPGTQPPDPRIYPDGFTLGTELGSDTGEIVRHRGFYLFDRSIPVGFQRGRDNNLENALLVRRFIE